MITVHTHNHRADGLHRWYLTEDGKILTAGDVGYIDERRAHAQGVHQLRAINARQKIEPAP